MLYPRKIIIITRHVRVVAVAIITHYKPTSKNAKINFSDTIKCMYRNPVYGTNVCDYINVCKMNYVVKM